MKQKIYRILNVAFYPFALVMAFRTFAFERYEWLMIQFILMTIIAIINEIGGRLSSRKADILTDTLIMLAEKVKEEHDERDQLKLDRATLAEELAEMKENERDIT